MLQYFRVYYSTYVIVTLTKANLDDFPGAEEWDSDYESIRLPVKYLPKLTAEEVMNFVTRIPLTHFEGYEPNYHAYSSSFENDQWILDYEIETKNAIELTDMVKLFIEDRSSWEDGWMSGDDYVIENITEPDFLPFTEKYGLTTVLQDVDSVGEYFYEHYPETSLNNHELDFEVAGVRKIK